MTETFSPNRSIDASIKELLPLFSISSQTRMKKAIRDAARAARKHGDENTDAGARHVYREFIPAAELNRLGYSLEYNETLDGLTPDWHDNVHRLLIESYTFERGATSSFLSRLNDTVSLKCARYGNIVRSNSLRFLVSAYVDFASGMDLEECENQLPQLRALFDKNDCLWSLLYFSETHVENRRQRYGYLCVCRDQSYHAMPAWPFRTVKI